MFKAGDIVRALGDSGGSAPMSCSYKAGTLHMITSPISPVYSGNVRTVPYPSKDTKLSNGWTREMFALVVPAHAASCSLGLTLYPLDSD